MVFAEVRLPSRVQGKSELIVVFCIQGRPVANQSRQLVLILNFEEALFLRLHVRDKSVLPMRVRIADI